MKNKKSLLFSCIILSIVLLTSLVAGCQRATPAEPTSPTTPTAQEKSIRIGVIMGITGFFSVREVPDLYQAEIARDMINEQGGITVNGEKYKVELVVADTKSTMDGVTAAANKLVFDEKIKFIIGPTAFFAAAAAICDPNKVLRFVTWGVNTPGEVDATTPYAFLGGSGSVLTSVAIVKYLKKTYPNVKKVAWISPDDGSPAAMIGIDTDLLNEQGISIVGEPLLYPNETQDFSAFAAKLNAVKEADAIFLQNGLVPHIGAIVKGLREMGNYKPFAGSLPARISQIMTITGPDALKDVFTTGYTPTDPNMPPIAKEIVNKVMAEHGADYQLEMTAPNCLWIIKEGIEAAQSMDPTVVKEKLESMDEVDTIWGPAKISGEKTFGIKHVVASPQTIQVLKDGVETSAGWIDLGYIP
jgi:branched-chain amino acid transport system substrate-binding protein